MSRSVVLALVIAATLSCKESSVSTKQTNFRPSFFDQVEPIHMRDGLAVALGAMADQEPLVYSYRDAVKTAGHSCLAISGAYRLTQIALRQLHDDSIPERGNIEVIFKGAVDHKVNGPISQIVTLITGAAAENGFHGFGDGRFKRSGLLRFDASSAPAPDVIATVVFKRLDTGASLQITYANGMVPPDPDMQQRVRAVLLDELEGMFTVERL